MASPDQTPLPGLEAVASRLEDLDLGDPVAAELELEALLDLLGTHPPSEGRAKWLHLRLGTLRQKARTHRAQGRTLKALLALDEHLALARGAEDHLEVARGLNTRATLLTDALELDASEACLREALELLARHEDQRVEAWVLGNLGVVQLLRYEFAEALERFDQLERRLDADQAEGFGVGLAVNRAACLLGLGRHAEARALLAPLLAPDGERAGAPIQAATILSMDAECQAHLGEADAAVERSLAAIELAEGSHHGLARIATRRSHGRILARLEPPDVPGTARAVTEALALAQELGDPKLVLELRQELAGLRARAGEPHLAAEDLAAGLEGDLAQGLEHLGSLARERGAEDHAPFDELERLRTQVDEQRFTLRSVAHDLRSPLTAILLGAEEQLLDSPRGDAFSELVRGQALRIRELVDMLTDLGALEADGHAHDAHDAPRLHLAEAVEPAVRTARALAGPGRVDVHGSLDLTVQAERLAVTRILDNLLGNAVRYSPSPSEVELRVEPAGARVRLEVRDRGPGLGDDDVEALFEPFRRGSGAATSGRGGSGLGLTVARRLAEALGGSLTGRTRAGGGACFRLELPLAP